MKLIPPSVNRTRNHRFYNKTLYRFDDLQIYIKNIIIQKTHKKYINKFSLLSPRVMQCYDRSEDSRSFATAALSEPYQ